MSRAQERELAELVLHTKLLKVGIATCESNCVNSLRHAAVTVRKTNNNLICQFNAYASSIRVNISDHNVLRIGMLLCWKSLPCI